MTYVYLHFRRAGGYTLAQSYAHLPRDTQPQGPGMTPRDTDIPQKTISSPIPLPPPLSALTSSSLIHAIAVSIFCSRSLTRRPLLSCTRGTVRPFSCGDPIILACLLEAFFSNESTKLTSLFTVKKPFKCRVCIQRVFLSRSNGNEFYLPWNARS